MSKLPKEWPAPVDWITDSELAMRQRMKTRPYAVLCYCGMAGINRANPWIVNEHGKWRRWRLLDAKQFVKIKHLQGSRSWARTYAPFNNEKYLIVVGRTGFISKYITEYSLLGGYPEE